MIRVDQNEFERLVKTRNIKPVVFENPDGFVLTSYDAVLINTQGKIRTFAKLNSVHNFIKGAGLDSYEVSTESIEV
jgi:hypothetical protein